MSALLSPAQERPFLLAAASAAAIGAGSYAFGSADWAASFSYAAVFSTLSWYCSAVVIKGVSEKRGSVALWAGPLKIVSLASLIIGLRTLGLELSSFLLALNLYIAAAAACIALDAVARRIRESGAVAHPASSTLESPTSSHA